MVENGCSVELNPEWTTPLREWFIQQSVQRWAKPRNKFSTSRRPNKRALLSLLSWWNMSSENCSDQVHVRNCWRGSRCNGSTIISGHPLFRLQYFSIGTFIYHIHVMIHAMMSAIVLKLMAPGVAWSNNLSSFLNWFCFSSRSQTLRERRPENFADTSAMVTDVSVSQ